MNKKMIIGSTIAVAILIGVSFTSVVGYNSVKSDVKASPLFTVRTKRAIDEEIEPKDYLFQTIIEIANNPEVKSLIKQVKIGLINYELDIKDVFIKLLVKNPRLLFSMLFTTPSITYDYLESTCNRGIKLVNILGEDEVIKMIESIEISNSEIFIELNNIIMNNEELFNRITTLKEMNEELKHPIICTILMIAIISLGFPWIILDVLVANIPEDSILFIIVALIFIPLELIFASALWLFIHTFECMEFPWLECGCQVNHPRRF